MSVSVGVMLCATLLVVTGGWGMVNGWRQRSRERRLLETIQIHRLGQRLPEFERELNRARRTERRLAVAVLALESGPDERRASRKNKPWIERWVYLLVGSILRDLLREHDIVAYDPATDRHVLQLTESDRSQAGQLVERIREEVEARTSLSLRGGVAQFPEDGLTLQELLRHAGENCGSWRAVADIDAADRIPVAARGRRVADTTSEATNSP